MSFQPSRTETIKTLFHNNIFVIPSYQRRYSWRSDQRKALWDDISENLQIKHFIGTLSFHKTDSGNIINDVYEIIDGQQRTTTLYILLNVLIEKLTDNDKKDSYQKLFIGTIEDPKLIPLGIDADFLKQLIFNYSSIQPSEIKARSQKLLYEAKRDYHSFAKDFDPVITLKWIEYIAKSIEILIFNVSDQAEAIKMFSVINDRGLPLSKLDKTKSLLMLYSTLYLNKELNDEINTSFEVIFNALDDIIISKDELKLFARIDENELENTIFAHHYYSSRDLFDDWDYELGSENIFIQLKRKCEKLKSDQPKLTSFIKNYSENLRKFTVSYQNLFREIPNNPLYVKPFLFLEFTATLFPLLVRLYEKEILDQVISLLETTEVRVFKLKNTNPRRKMYQLSSDVASGTISVKSLLNQIIDFNQDFLNDNRFVDYLSDRSIDKKVSLVRYIFYEMNRIKGNQIIDRNKYKEIEIEHIFSGTPNFDYTPYGFSKIEYDVEISKIGNLTILESGLNKSIRNFSPSDKIGGYQQSDIYLNINLMGQLAAFNKSHVQSRTEEISNFCLQRFSIN